MRPPMTATKNDGVPPSHRRVQYSQKEVLAENQRIRPSKQESSHQPHQTSDPVDYFPNNFDTLASQQQGQSDRLVRVDYRNQHSDYLPQVVDGDEIPTRISQFGSKLKRMSSDVSGHSLNYVRNTTPPLRHNHSAGVKKSACEVPSKNLFVNSSFDSSTVSVLPLSETEPLLTNIEATVTDPKRSICLSKNSASLIFTKKDSVHGGNSSGSSSGSSVSSASSSSSNQSSSVVHRRSSSGSFGANRRHLESARYSNSGRTVLQHRRSLQLNYPNNSQDTPGLGQSNTSTPTSNRKQHSYSWYAPVYSALEEEFEADSRDSSPIHNLANIHRNHYSENASIDETLSLLVKPQTTPQPQLHQQRIRRPNLCIQQSTTIGGGVGGQNHQIQNDLEGPHAASLLGGPMPRRRRFESFLKSLVGRKPSKEAVNPVPLLPSPEIKITHSPSEHSLLRDNSGPGAERIGSSTTSLNVVQQKLWNVVPLLKREGSSASLRQEKANSIVQYTGLRKCETVLALSRSSYLEPIKPLNRLRNSLSTSNATCSRCSSLLSLAASGSRYSLNPANSGFVTVTVANPSANENAFLADASISTGTDTSFLCKLCLADVKVSAATSIGQCRCIFCTECMVAYIEFEISEGAYEISCPDAQCPKQGTVSLEEIQSLVTTNSLQKYRRYRLYREIELDKTRTWCPRAGCETICPVGYVSPTPSSSDADKVNSITQVLCAVQCPTCKEEFCSGCKKPFHPNVTCEENGRILAAEGLDDTIGIPFDNDLIKSCPMCAVPIEKDEGCAQMMCKRCKHVFCWYCLASLDDDFLLRHYDKGPCKNKLGHSRASVVWHRAQVIGIFAGFGILLLVASPLLLLAAPCIICCKCRICSGTTKLDDADTDLEDAVALQS